MGIAIPNPLTSHNVYVQIAVVVAEVIGVTILILAATFIAARFFSTRLRRQLQRTGVTINVAILLARAGWIGIWIAGIGALLYYYGVSPTPLAAFIGVVGLAASLSLQQVLQNLVAGIYLLAEHPFAIGDIVAVVGPTGLNHVGKVEDIQMRTTHLRSLDDETILVPNAAIFSGVITNRSVTGGHAVHTTVIFPRSLDIEEARSGTMGVLGATHPVLRYPAPEFRVTCMSKETWTAVITFWAERLDAASDVIWALGRQFPDAQVNAQDGAP
jgi:small conductance mechanosensitive channel